MKLKDFSAIHCLVQNRASLIKKRTVFESLISSFEARDSVGFCKMYDEILDGNLVDHVSIQRAIVNEIDAGIFRLDVKLKEFGVDVD